MELKNICKSFGSKTIFDNLNIDFADNTCTVIIGRSGIGKTTLLNIIAGATPFCGEICGRGKVAYMLQEDVFVNNLSVADNLRLFTRKQPHEMLAMLGALGLGEVAQMSPSELSGGMQRRLSLLRALHYDADVLLLDEPFKSLDGETKTLCVNYLINFLRNNERLTIIVSHDPSELRGLLAHVVNLETLVK